MREISKRIREFEELGKKGYTTFDFRPYLDLDVYATIETELAFCISTASSSAKSGLIFQKKIENIDLTNLSNDELERYLKKSGVRFHRKKAKYIIEAIKKIDKIFLALELNSQSAREFLVKEFKGLGLKEASHFLRNVGRKDLAVIDRHIARWIGFKGKIQKNTYFDLEWLLAKKASKMGYDLATFDLFIWSEATGLVLK